MMRIFLLAFACIAMSSTGASACRALWEYPQTMAEVASLDVAPAVKEAYEQKLEAGFALHEQGRVNQNVDLMKEAVKMLDDINIELGQ